MAATKDRKKKLPVFFTDKAKTSHILLCHILLPYSMAQTSPAQILETPFLNGESIMCVKGGKEFMAAIFGKLPQDF